jgi:lysophospholipase L1-like esterase
MLETLLALTLFTTMADPPSDLFARWSMAIAAMEKRDQAKPPPEGAVFFCGSSSIVKWKLEESFPDLKVVNRGFGGSHLADSVYFAPRILLPYKPSAIVLYAGDNDIAAGKTPEKVYEDFQNFVKIVREKMPRTPIYFLSIKPSIARWKRIDTIRKANALIEAECKKGEGLVFVDVGTALLGDDGKPCPELFAKDGLHLSADGYAIWTKILRKVLPKNE